MSEITRRLLSRCTISVRWRDLDTYNHVNNSVFLSYLEEARLVWLRGLQGEWKSATSAPVIAFFNLKAGHRQLVRQFVGRQVNINQLFKPIYGNFHLYSC